MYVLTEMIGRVSFVTQWLDFGSLKLRLGFGKSMLWTNKSRTCKQHDVIESDKD